MELFDLHGKKAIVTGGSRGLGYGMAEGLMEHGCEVVIWGSTTQTEKAAEDFRERGYLCHGVWADLSSPAELREGFAESLEKLGGEIDILVNSAGIQRRHAPEEFPLEDWSEVLRVNLTAAFELCQLAGRVMLERHRTSGACGKIINIASMISFFGGQNISAYAASKGGIVQMTKALSNDWAGRGITVNAIAPGYMVTDMNEALLKDKNRLEQISARIPKGRWGTGEDMKGAAVFLASKASDYVTGAVIPVDGGYLAK